MLVKKFASRFLGTNTYVVACESSREAAVIDPGGKVAPVLEAVRAEGLTVKYVLNTHGHVDHIWRNAEVRAATGAPIHVHEADARQLARPRWWLPLVRGRRRLSPPADVLVRDGDALPLGLQTIEVIHTPGHTPGGVCFRVRKHLFTGDTLFAGGIGRVDMKGGDLRAILDSIRDRLLVLSDDLRVHPGHGPDTTIERERLYNPFLRARDEVLQEVMLPKRKRTKAAETAEPA
jgi:glyoxylase-like metal-dependent hydrolase (beta-lactamase superfamily II)